ncbi:MAG: hypothetical protein GXO63_01190 [Candidatus Micrarchaeota archaeon]|nr:hypothetical protein [Candidatus Micrarchaeota archaeon]
MEKTDKMKMTDLAIYIVLNAKDKGKDPLKIGNKLAYKLRLRPDDAETLTTMILAAEAFGVPEDIKGRVEREVPRYQCFEMIQKLLYES